MLFADPFTFDIERCLIAFNRHAPGTRVVGGMTSAGTRPGANALLLNDWIAHEGGVGLALKGALRVDVVVSQGCRPVGPALEVTRADGNLVFELDGQPAIERAEQVLRALPQAEQALLRNGLYVGRPARRGATGPGDYLIRNLLGADRGRGALAVADVMAEQEQIRLHVRDADSAVEDLELLLSPQEFDSPAAAALLFACNGRGVACSECPTGTCRRCGRRWAARCPWAACSAPARSAPWAIATCFMATPRASRSCARGGGRREGQAAVDRRRRGRAARGGAGGDVRPAEPRDDARSWWAHIRVLAADSLRGRMTGTADYLAAARYVAAEFREQGVRPGGAPTPGVTDADEPYFQHVPFVWRRIREPECSLALVHGGVPTPLELGKDATLGAGIEAADSLDAPMVFAGYGLSVPEAGYDDLQGLDLRGKLAVYVRSGPTRCPHRCARTPRPPTFAGRGCGPPARSAPPASRRRGSGRCRGSARRADG